MSKGRKPWAKRLTPEQRSIVEEMIDWWRSQPEHERPAMAQMRDFLARKGIEASETATRRMLNVGLDQS